MRFEKPKKSGRSDFAAGRIAELERQLATETNETRKSELRNEINEWQRSRPQARARPRNVDPQPVFFWDLSWGVSSGRGDVRRKCLMSLSA